MAPFSTVPLKVTVLLVTVSPSSGEVTVSLGGVVSFGGLGAAAVVGAAVVVVCSSAEDDAVVVVSSVTARVVEEVVYGVVRVVAVRLSASETRSARTAEATRADMTPSGVVDVSVSSATSSSVDDPVDGENAAKPITARKATMRRPAYARGARGLT